MAGAVRDVPADRTKLPPFLNNAVHVAHDEQELAPLMPVHRVQCVLHSNKHQSIPQQPERSEETCAAYRVVPEPALFRTLLLVKHEE